MTKKFCLLKGVFVQNLYPQDKAFKRVRQETSRLFQMEMTYDTIAVVLAVANFW